MAMKRIETSWKKALFLPNVTIACVFQLHANTFVNRGAFSCKKKGSEQPHLSITNGFFLCIYYISTFFWYISSFSPTTTPINDTFVRKIRAILVHFRSYLIYNIMLFIFRPWRRICHILLFWLLIYWPFWLSARKPSIKTEYGWQTYWEVRPWHQKMYNYFHFYHAGKNDRIILFVAPKMMNMPTWQNPFLHTLTLSSKQCRQKRLPTM